MDGLSLNFSWQPPTGDRVILSYTLRCSVNGTIEFSVQLNSVLQIILDELKPNITYSCTVYASSSGGDGPSTAPVSAMTEGRMYINLCDFN